MARHEVREFIQDTATADVHFADELPAATVTEMRGRAQLHSSRRGRGGVRIDVYVVPGLGELIHGEG